MALVEVVNNGGADAIVGRVLLRATDGSAGFSFMDSDKDDGPSMPHRLEANGGRASWAFDYNELRRHYTTTVRDEDLVLKAIVRVGSREHRSQGSLWVARPDQTGRRPTPAQRARTAVSALLHPYVQLMGRTDLSALDLDAGTVPLSARNFGWRWSRPFTATLIAHNDSNGEQSQVPNIEQARFPWIGPQREYRIMVPLAEDPPSDVSLWWSITSGPGIGNGVGAMTWSRARAHQERLEEDSRQPECEEEQGPSRSRLPS